jgi:hypothetical protein
MSIFENNFLGEGPMRRLVVLSGEEKKARAAGYDDCVPEPLQPTPTTGENSAVPVLNLGLIAALRNVCVCT